MKQRETRLRFDRGGFAAAAVSLGLAGFGSASATAQEPRVVAVSATATCPSCRVDRQLLFKLGSATDPIRPSGLMTVERDSRGRFFAVGEDHFSIVVFDPNGKYLTAFGRKGGGPGEFQARIRGMRLIRGDSLIVIAGGEAHLFNPGLRHVRRLGSPPSLATLHQLPDGRFVGSVDIRTPDKVGWPFALLNKDGSVNRFFGPDVPLPQRGGIPRGYVESLNNPRPPMVNFASPMVLTRDSRAVLAVVGYGFERWDIFAPTERVRVTIEAPWLARPRRVEIDSVFERGRWTHATITPIPDATFIGIDSDGLLWFVERTPRPGSRGAIGKPAEMDNRFSIIDPETRRVIARDTVGVFHFRVPDSDLSISGTFGDDGFPILTVWRTRLVRPRGARRQLLL
jgi:hypothetical protein